MIQINLLPDVKAEYVKAQRTKHMVVVISFIVIVSCLVVLAILLSTAYGGQKLQLNNAKTNIDKNLKTVQSYKDLDKVLTIQNQLKALTPLHVAKPVVSRTFTYLQQITPSDVRIDTFTVNFAENTIQLDGNADSVIAVNRFVDTLKFTTIAPVPEGQDPQNAFSSVILQSFSTSDSEVTYSISLKVDPELFNSENKDIKLVVPVTVTTRSQTQLPLFIPNKTPTTEDN